MALDAAHRGEGQHGADLAVLRDPDAVSAMVPGRGVGRVEVSAIL
jgi:hypothetical protein